MAVERKEGMAVERKAGSDWIVREGRDGGRKEERIRLEVRGRKGWR